MTAVSMSMTLAKAGSLFILTFFSEDAATLGGATLTATGLLATPLAFAACFLGIWLGDLGLFVLARYFGRPLLDRNWVQRRVSADQLARSEAWLKRRGLLVLLIARFVPGLRLPTYLMAGTLAVPFLYFATVTGLIGLVWVTLIFALVRIIGAQAAIGVQAAHSGFTLVILAVTAILLASLAVSRWKKIHAIFRVQLIHRWSQWEFWPAWLFYLPVGLNYLWLGLKYRGFNLPTVANPGMYTGGLVGESKCLTLVELWRESPKFTAWSGLITATHASERMAQFEELCHERQMELPVVLKPDVAQRGSGFKLVRSVEEAREYLGQVLGNVVLQEYIPGPSEAGIFYYRFPHEECGSIFAITDKIFPVIFGDGKRTIEQLIRDDARAAMMATIYLQRHGSLRTKVLPFGKSLKLVEAGNHAQGCIFRDGMHLWSEQLEARIDQISRKLPGFFIGRYDVRYASEADIRRGEGFKILELNGAASEATSIYDDRNSLFSAYATLFKQWGLVFAIGAANRNLGHHPATLRLLWDEWRKYQQRSACYPLAD